MLVMSVYGVCFVSCGDDDANNETTNPTTSNEAKVYFVYTLDTSTGDKMTRGAKTSAEVFDEFYQKIKTGDLVAPSFELTLTEVNSGVVYTFKGKWNSHDLLTLRTGTYRVIGKSTAEGENIQEKCSFTFDEQIDINITSNVITLHAKYDCSLLIFNKEKIQTLQNFNGSVLDSFFTFSTYKYAFVNNILYDVAKKNDAYIFGKYTDDAEFKIFTGNLNFEKGKYYVYNSISNGFDVPPMDEGNSTITDNSVSTLIIDSNSQPIIVGGYIKNFSKANVSRKGIIVSNCDDNMEITNETDFDYADIFLRGKENKVIDTPSDIRFIDCTETNEEQFACALQFLIGNTDYYVRAFAIDKSNNIYYGGTEKVHTKDYNRYKGSADYGNVWYAFNYTLFDHVTDEIIEPSDGFYYTTNENPTTVKNQVGTSYNTCYKFLTEWNYKLWYGQRFNWDNSPKKKGLSVHLPKMKYADGTLTIEKNPLDADKEVTIYYSIDGNYFRPENYTKVYSQPLVITEPCSVYCYAISSEGIISYTNIYIIGNN